MNTYILSIEESSRLNILKYIAIIFVVYIHAYAVDVNFADGTNTFLLPWWLLFFENLVSQTIAQCGVPLFFLISSILLFKKQRDYKSTIKEKIKSLFIPYFIWNSFWICVFAVLQNLSFTAPYFSGNHTPILDSSFSEWLALYGIGFSLPYPQDYPLWFMRDLMLVTLLFPVVEKIADKFPKFLFAGAVITLVIPADFPLKEAFLWFCIGACIVKLQIHMTLFDNISTWKLFFVYAICASIKMMVNSHIINVLFIYIGIIFWLRVSKSIYNCEKAKNIFLRLSTWTFMIYVAHEMTLSSLKKICFRLLPTEPIWLLMEYLLLPAVVIIGCSIAGAILKRATPKLYSVATGAR